MTQNHHEAIIDSVRGMLSELSCVQSILNVGNAIDALDHIYFHSAKEDGTENPPRYVVRWGEGTGNWETGVGTLPVWITSQWLAPEAYQSSESVEARWASGQHQTLLNEIRTARLGSGAVMLGDFTDAVIKVPKEEVPATITNRFVWESFIEVEVRR